MLVKQLVLRTFVLGAIAASATLAAKADTLDFTLTGQGTDITWTLSSTPMVSTTSNYLDDFTLDNVVLDVNGHHDVSDLSFYKSGNGGGAASNLFNLFGAQLFTGSLSDPTFKTGDFTLDSSSNDYSYCKEGSSYNLSIVDRSAVTPEPSSVLLLATGIFALIGAGAMKRFAA